MEPDSLIQMQNDISSLRQQVAQANQSLQEQIAQTIQAVAIATQSISNVNNTNSNSNSLLLKTGKPEKFNSENARSRLKSIATIFAAHSNTIDDNTKINYALSYMTGAGLQWWELATLNGNILTSYEEFQKELINYFQPVNRELTARKMLSDLKQMGKLTLVQDYNREFSRWLLQISSMTAAEQIFHYSQGLNTRTIIEVERAEPQSLQDAMKIADRLDSLFNSGQNYLVFPRSTHIFSSVPTPIQIGNIQPFRSTKLSPAENVRRIEHRLCFVWGKPNCIARNHYHNQRPRPNAFTQNKN